MPLDPLAVIRPYLLYVKAGLVLLLLIGLVAFWLLVKHWHTKSLRVDAAEARSVQIERDAAKTIAQYQAAYKRSQEASNGYQNELAAIAARPVSRTPVRLCNATSVRPSGPVVGGPGQTLPAAGVLAAENGGDHSEGPDIRDDLNALAAEMEAVTAQGRAIQSLH